MNLEIDEPKLSLREMLERRPNAKQMILDAAFEALGAKRGWREKGQSGVKWEPDYKTRLDAARFLAAYIEGLPVVTTLAVNVGDQGQGETAMDLETAAEKSPALRSRLQKLLGQSTT